MKAGTIAVSWGPSSGGFYVTTGRICFGRIALTIVPRVEVDALMRAYVERMEEQE